MSRCVWSIGFNEQLLNEVELAIKECSEIRLQNLLRENKPSKSQIGCRNLLHQAAWLGHTSCVQLLLDYGLDPDRPHTSNGCTPLHLAHFCTIEDRDCYKTIYLLTEAGANIDNPGGHRCGKVPLRHAIQHQRVDSVRALLCKGCRVDLSSILLAMDIGNFAVFEMLLIHGGNCGPKLECNPFWGEVLQRFIQLPLKPSDLSRQMLRLIIRATLTMPQDAATTAENPPTRVPGSSNLYAERRKQFNSRAEHEIRKLFKNPLHKQLALSLLDGLLRNGFHLNKSLAILAARNGFDGRDLKLHLICPQTLQGICVHVLRAALASHNGNVYERLKLIEVPLTLKNFILLNNLY